jgi:hypothetical protein
MQRNEINKVATYKKQGRKQQHNEETQTMKLRLRKYTETNEQEECKFIGKETENKIIKGKKRNIQKKKKKKKRKAKILHKH